ncbi:MAG: hypothetical protein HYS56_02830 [Candidatus Omnitrophica bacterium]|nr:hypothetical protein [Candidatus Omnitrophota bacterium]
MTSPASGGANELFQFLIRSLLCSQLELKREQDDEVNVYLAHLLFYLMDPRYRQWTSRYIQKYDSAVYRQVEQAEQDRVRKYFIYKLNADHLLTSLGIFQNLGNPRGTFRRFYEQRPEIYVGRGKAYYSMAARYNHQIHRRPTTVEEVLDRLAFSFEDYVKVLAHMRSGYLDFIRRVSQEDIAQWVRQWERGERGKM